MHSTTRVVRDAFRMRCGSFYAKYSMQNTNVIKLIFSDARPPFKNNWHIVPTCEILHASLPWEILKAYLFTTRL